MKRKQAKIDTIEVWSIRNLKTKFKYVFEFFMASIFRVQFFESSNFPNTFLAIQSRLIHSDPRGCHYEGVTVQIFILKQEFYSFTFLLIIFIVQMWVK